MKVRKLKSSGGYKLLYLSWTCGGETVLKETASVFGRELTKLERTSIVFSVAVSPWRRRGRERDELRNDSRCSRRTAWGHPLEKDK